MEQAITLPALQAFQQKLDEGGGGEEGKEGKERLPEDPVVLTCPVRQ